MHKCQNRFTTKKMREVVTNLVIYRFLVTTAKKLLGEGDLQGKLLSHWQAAGGST